MSVDVAAVCRDLDDWFAAHEQHTLGQLRRLRDTDPARFAVAEAVVAGSTDMSVEARKRMLDRLRQVAGE